MSNPVKVGKVENPIIPKVWITKYALTTGIATAVNVVHCLGTSDRMIGVPQGRNLGDAYFHKPDWHTTEQEAYARVKEMFDAEQKSLTKRQAKLDARKRDWAAGTLPTQPWGQSEPDSEDK